MRKLLAILVLIGALTLTGSAWALYDSYIAGSHAALYTSSNWCQSSDYCRVYIYDDTAYADSTTTGYRGDWPDYTTWWNVPGNRYLHVYLYKSVNLNCYYTSPVDTRYVPYNTDAWLWPVQLVATQAHGVGCSLGPVG